MLADIISKEEYELIDTIRMLRICIVDSNTDVQHANDKISTFEKELAAWKEILGTRDSQLKNQESRLITVLEELKTTLNARDRKRPTETKVLVSSNPSDNLSGLESRSDIPF